jgi:hypothetical protein
MPSDLYNRGKTVVASTSPWVPATSLQVLLATSAYTPNEDHNTVSQITNELSGGGYVRKTLASVTATQDDTNNRAILDAADVTWTGLSGSTPTYAIIFDNAGGSDAARSLIGWVELTTPPAPNGGDYIVEWAATGLFLLT